MTLTFVILSALALASIWFLGGVIRSHFRNKHSTASRPWETGDAIRGWYGKD